MDQGFADIIFPQGQFHNFHSQLRNGDNDDDNERTKERTNEARRS